MAAAWYYDTDSASCHPKSDVRFYRGSSLLTITHEEDSITVKVDKRCEVTFDIHDERRFCLLYREQHQRAELATSDEVAADGRQILFRFVRESRGASFRQWLRKEAGSTCKISGM